MSSNQSGRRGGVEASSKSGRGRSEGAKRKEIMAAATERFGRDGYEHTKWADIAADVGVGPTALYHYFESKQHCLFVIMDEAIEDFRARFVARKTDRADPLQALAGVLQDCFELTKHEILRNRVLVAEQGLLATPRTSPREEQAREAARGRVRELQFEWATCLSQAMKQGAIPDSDPRLLTRAILGLYNSIWQWYRPDGMLPLPRAADFFIERALAMIGVAPEGVSKLRMVA
jgi:TetR/AcrR family transcriptional regulator, cholesterol catabolism regulator